MVRGSALMNAASSVLDAAANKTAELYIGCLALGCGWRITLDDPDHSSGGANPDVILERRGSSWSIAVKTIHGRSSQTIFDNIKGAVRQIERSGKPGIVFISLKNRIDHGELLLPIEKHTSVESANDTLDHVVRELIWRLRQDIVDVDWVDAFQGKLARPIVAFMGQSVAPAQVTPERSFYVPIRLIAALPVPPLVTTDPKFVGLDQEAWDMLGELNRELQRPPPSS
jgi:hypothetical protein